MSTSKHTYNLSVPNYCVDSISASLKAQFINMQMNMEISMQMSKLSPVCLPFFCSNATSSTSRQRLHRPGLEHECLHFSSTHFQLVYSFRSTQLNSLQSRLGSICLWCTQCKCIRLACARLGNSSFGLVVFTPLTPMPCWLVRQ